MLQKECPQRATDEATISGVSTVSQRRGLTQQEIKRVEAARHRAELTSWARITWSFKFMGYQPLVLSELSCGWIGRSPQLKVANDFFNKLSHALGTGKGASIDLTTHFMVPLLGCQWWF